MAESEDNPSSDKNEDEMVGYRQQPESCLSRNLALVVKIGSRSRLMQR